MYPFLPLGPLTVPTLPLFALLGAWLGLSVAARVGARQSLDPDRVLSAGVTATAAGIIVARLWRVVQFWGIYQQDLLLVFSPRPGGLALWPGLAAAFIGGYAYLLRARLDPTRTIAAMAVGMLFCEGALQIGSMLAGQVVGAPSLLPWSVPHFGESVHPLGLYRAAGAWTLVGLLLWLGNRVRGMNLLLMAVLGYGAVRLVADGFLAGGTVIGGARVSQIGWWLAALSAALLLASRREAATASEGEVLDQAEPLGQGHEPRP